jgi:hypothetical protein
MNQEVSKQSRIPHIRVNLLPPEIIHARRQRRVGRITIALVLTLMAGLIGWYAQASQEISSAQERLGRMQDQLQQATTQQKSFAELINAQGESLRISTQLSNLIASDLAWSTLITKLQQVAPTGVSVTGVFASLLDSSIPGTSSGTGDSADTTTESAADTTTAQQPGAASGGQTSNTKIVASLTITATASNKSVAADYVDALETVEGMANPFVSDALRQEGILRFTVRFDITRVALTGRYSKQPTAKQSTGTGGK